MPSYVDQAYFSSAFHDDPKKMTDTMLESIGDEFDTFDTVIGTGLSGTIFICRTEQHLSKRFGILRKPGVSSHADRELEGSVGTGWIFVDDFISSGATFRRVATHMTINHPDSVFAGVYLYENNHRAWLNRALALDTYSGLMDIVVGPLQGPMPEEYTEEWYSPGGPRSFPYRYNTPITRVASDRRVSL